MSSAGFTAKSHLLSSERSDRIQHVPRFVKGFFRFFQGFCGFSGSRLHRWKFFPGIKFPGLGNNRDIPGRPEIPPAVPGEAQAKRQEKAMQGKVEICGVNTAKLPVLKAAETRALIERAQQGDMAAREELISGNLRLVLSVIQKFAGRGESMDDLFQVGVIGLIKAVDCFDLNQKVQFSTYGVPMIAGELRRFLRDHSAIRVSRSMRDTAYKVLQSKEKLIAQTGREPDVEAIAKDLGLPRQDVVFAMEAICDPVSLYDPVYSDAGESACVMDQIGDTKNTDEQWLEQIALEEAIKRLSQREKHILALRFYDGRTQMEVAKEVGISQAQVSRLEKNAIDQIKKNISA